MADEGQGAPADFGGRVLPNPTGIKPTLDTDIKRKDPGFSAGAMGDTAQVNWSSPDHPLALHFTKKAATARKLTSSKPIAASEN